MQQELGISLSDSTGIQCPGCEGIFFRQTFLLRRWSRVLIGASQDVSQPVALFVCEQCGSPMPGSFPAGMKDIDALFGLTSEPETPKKSKLIQM